jgi:putative hydrolase of the HAD superfamily
MKYDAVIFDLFGTLVDDPAYSGDSGPEYHPVTAEVAAVLSIPESVFRSWWSATEDERYTGFFPTMEAYLENLCRQSGVRARPDQIANAVEIRLEYYLGFLTPRDDALHTLSQLKALGHKIGLISDCDMEVSIRWPSGPIAHLVDAAILSCEVGLRKPDLRIYRMVCDRLKVAPDRCLYVGDGNSKELTGAAEAGMTPVLIRAPYDTVNGSREEWLGVSISELKQVLNLV